MFIYVIDVVNNCLYVAIGGVFAFDDLNLSLATTCEVFDEFDLSVEGVPSRSDKVRFMVFGFMAWV
jgi:hypothetical protein